MTSRFPLLGDEKAVSPVIGVILMVAITVILAAVIGTFVLGLGQQVGKTTPQSSFSFDFDDTNIGSADTLTVNHDGGDSIPAGQITFTVTGATAIDADGTPSLGASFVSANAWSDFTALGESDKVKAGSSAGLTDSQFEDENGNVLPHDGGDADSDAKHIELESATVKVVWTSDDGQNSAVLATFEGPDA